MAPVKGSRSDSAEQTGVCNRKTNSSNNTDYRIFGVRLPINIEMLRIIEKLILIHVPRWKWACARARKQAFLSAKSEMSPSFSSSLITGSWNRNVALRPFPATTGSGHRVTNESCEERRNTNEWCWVRQEKRSEKKLRGKVGGKR